MADAVWAVLTPPGKGAIAVLGVAGPATSAIIAPLMGRTDLPAGPVIVGRFGEPGQADEVVVLVRSAEHVEICCHGGPAVVRLLGETLQRRGCRRVGDREWLERTLPGERWGLSPPETHDHRGVPEGINPSARRDSDRAEAIEILTRCPTMRTAAIALDYLAGAFDRDLAAGRLERLHNFASVGLHLDTPYRVVIVGAPNVGKSSLVNALAGFGRCLVSPTPGTTRDLVTTRIALDGWPIELVDTAGLRETNDPVESAGIERARDASAAADCLVWIRFVRIRRRSRTPRSI